MFVAGALATYSVSYFEYKYKQYKHYGEPFASYTRFASVYARRRAAGSAWGDDN